MKKIKRSTLTYILVFSLLAILNLFATTAVSKVFAQDKVLDETTATVKVVANGETNYYESFSDAVNNLPSNSTIVLLKEASFSSKRFLNCSIDLNGNILSGGGTTNYTNTLTVLDSKGSGKIAGSITFYSSNITVKSGLIEHIMLTDRSVATISGGKVNKINANGNSLNVTGGEIDNLCVYNSGSIHLSGGTINEFIFVSIAENFAMLNDGYVYTSKADNSPIKIADMTPSTQVTIVKCPHFAFTDSVCDYCNYICEHSGHYNQNGICEVCGFACSHLELTEKNICLECSQQMEATVKNSSISKNFMKLEDAVAFMQDGDTLTLCHDVTLENSLTINAVCTIDLCGYALDGFYVNLGNRIKVTDSKGNGYIAVSSYGSSAQIELNGAETTNFVVNANADRLKFYSGKIIRINILNGTIDNILPNEYLFVKHDNVSARKMTKQQTNVDTFYEDNCYLTCQVCKHDSVDDELNCKYCGNSLTQEQILQALAMDLEATKEELSQAITKKEDITTINKKVKELNDAISNAETICKTYSDEKNEQLKSQLSSLIGLAKQEAISSSNEALELAKNEFLSTIDKKLDIEEYNQKVIDLTNAISNAEQSSNAYADNKDLALKTELLNKIEESKTTLQNVNNEMLERLSKAETKIDSNAKDISTLKTALIVLSVLFVTIFSVGFVILYLHFNKKCNKKIVKL